MKMRLFSLMDIDRDAPEQESLRPAATRHFIQQTEEAGFYGILIPESNAGSLHPFFFAQEVLHCSEKLCPFIALNPAYAHPFFIAKFSANLWLHYKRLPAFNLITGTNLRDLEKLNDFTPHHERYARLQEYTELLLALLSGEPVTRNGKFYTVTNLQLPMGTNGVLPELYIGGSSSQAIATAKALNAALMQMAKPVEMLSSDGALVPGGFHFGIIARPTREAAQEVLLQSAPPDRGREILQKITFMNTDAVWKQELQLVALQTKTEKGVYTLSPFRYYYSDVPYLCGSYGEVAETMKAWLELGVHSAVIEIPAKTQQNEFTHIAEVLNRL